MEELIQEVGMEEVDDYVLRRQNLITQYIATRKILDLYEEVVWRPGMWVSRRWWEH